MATALLPFFSSTATGSIGRSLIFQNHINNTRIRIKTKQRNPRTPQQIISRSFYTLSIQQWSLMTPFLISFYTTLGEENKMNGFNYLVKETFLLIYQGVYDVARYGISRYYKA